MLAAAGQMETTAKPAVCSSDDLSDRRNLLRLLGRSACRGKEKRALRRHADAAAHRVATRVVPVSTLREFAEWARQAAQRENARAASSTMPVLAGINPDRLIIHDGLVRRWAIQLAKMLARRHRGVRVLSGLTSVRTMADLDAAITLLVALALRR